MWEKRMKMANDIAARDRAIAQELESLGVTEEDLKDAREAEAGMSEEERRAEKMAAAVELAAKARRTAAPAPAAEKAVEGEMTEEERRAKKVPSPPCPGPQKEKSFTQKMLCRKD